jgi:hypothetical protein
MPRYDSEGYGNEAGTDYRSDGVAVSGEGDSYWDQLTSYIGGIGDKMSMPDDYQDPTIGDDEGDDNGNYWSTQPVGDNIPLDETGGGDGTGGGGTGDGGTGGGGDGRREDFSEPGSWQGVDATDKDNEIADYLWAKSGPYTEGLFDGSYQEGLPNYSNYMQENGPGSLSNYMGQNQQGLTSYFQGANPAWDANAQHSSRMLSEQLGGQGGGGSASGGFSGQTAAGLGSFWSDNSYDRWNAMRPEAMAQWNQDSQSNLSDYSNLYGQSTMDFGNQLGAYNRPYDYSQSLWGPNNAAGPQQQQQQQGEGGNFWSSVGTVAGMGIGGYLGGPLGASIGGGAGSIFGSIFD